MSMIIVLYKIIANSHNNSMLIVFLRAIILFSILLLVVRLMGKRQLGEMEPFELVITLVISELACIPVADRNIPITFGVVAILSMFAIHQLLLLISKNSRMQKIVSGKPVLVYDSNGIVVDNLTALNMQVGDLLQSLRATGHFSLEEITFGAMETSGQLSVIANKNYSQQQQYLQCPLIVSGKWDVEEMENHKVTKEQLYDILRRHHTSPKRVVLFSIDENNRYTLQVARRPILFDTLRGDKLLK